MKAKSLRARLVTINRHILNKNWHNDLQSGYSLKQFIAPVILNFINKSRFYRWNAFHPACQSKRYMAQGLLTTKSISFSWNVFFVFFLFCFFLILFWQLRCLARSEHDWRVKYSLIDQSLKCFQLNKFRGEENSW